MATTTVSPGRKVLTINQVMAVYRVSRRTVYNWMNAGHVEWARSVSRRYIYEDSLPLLIDMRATNAEVTA